MATENPNQPVTKIAGSNVTNLRGVVEVAGGIVNRAGAGVAIDGVVAMISSGTNGTTISAGNEVPVTQCGGTVIGEAGAAVADRARVMMDASGRFITFAAGGGAVAVGEVVNGSSAAAAGDEISVLLYPKGQAVA